jgi:two-component system, NarL family, sensor histidine kinase BarA
LRPGKWKCDLQTEGKQLEVTLFVDDSISLIETDGGKLQQIIFNLFSNAVKFTPSGGQIDITAKKVIDSLQISVTDTGPGIAEEDRDKIFEKFRQLDGSVTREHGGVGLGLAIVKELVGILGGAISVANRTGGGSVFTVSIPLRPEVAK